MTQAALAQLKSGIAGETIAFAPTGEVIVAAGEKGGKEATARLRKVVGDYTEQVNADLQQREADEARAVEQKVETGRSAACVAATPASPALSWPWARWASSPR